MKNLYLATLLFSMTLTGASQPTKRVCLTHLRHLKQMETDSDYQAKRARYQVPTEKQSNRKTASETVYSIPVVIHVIHNGEAIGTGTNISDDQINSAITALNLDFRSTNTDTLAPTHPFYPLQADVKMEFCLAKKDPQGAATTGIIRYNKGKAAWGVDDFEVNVKPSTFWDINKYLNIWIMTFGSPDETTLGYATLPGWPTDSEVGVVIGASYFGTVGDLTPGFDKNRTATHEVGHFFNLSHIWGDATCGDDFVSDTPPQEGSNDSYCPTFPHNVSSQCNPGSNGEMFMNYMDYTTDNCMQLFTTGQKERMRAAILLSDRIGLTTSAAEVCGQPDGLNEKILSGVSIYPNPSSNSVSIALPTNFEFKAIEVYTINGNQVNVNHQYSGGKVEVNTTQLSNGTYILAVTGRFGTVNKNLVIIK